MSDLDPKIHKDKKVTIGGILTKVRIIHTKRGNKEMAFGTLEDENTAFDIVFFPRTWEELKSKIAEDKPYLITGKLDVRDEQLNMLADKIREVQVDIEEDDPTIQHTLEIPSNTPREILLEIGKILKANPGEEKMAIILNNGTPHKKTILLPYTITYSDDIESQVQELLENQN